MVALKNIVLFTLSSSVAVQGLSIVPAVKPLYERALSVFNFQSEQSIFEQPKVIYASLPDVDEKPVPGDSPIVQCDASQPQILSLESVVIDPNPPLRGANLTFIANGYISEDIEEGAYVEVDVRYGFIKLIHQTFDFCEEVSKIDLECPISKGQQVITKEVAIPNEVPPGKYIVNARAYTKDDVFITCLTATIEFPPI
ncbi:Phosphatidylglycerol/phosphatidylinositol transfer protein [Scheffersomyces coipomensis]|uniref:Phosphatidylglycerol/phosphatidylinositol transfer protein n=1 Tax=Scheffersomyces coipomensis TaxID=1788519 RepID=UPI00315DB254